MIKKRTNPRIEITISLGSIRLTDEERFEREKKDLYDLLKELEHRHYVNTVRHNAHLVGDTHAVVTWDVHLYCEYCEDPISGSEETRNCVECGQWICVHCGTTVNAEEGIVFCDSCWTEADPHHEW